MLMMLLNKFSRRYICLLFGYASTTVLKGNKGLKQYRTSLKNRQIVNTFEQFGVDSIS